MAQKKFTMSVIDRDPKEFTRERKGDMIKTFHLQSKSIHKFQHAREYTRALNAVKLDKLFAKPFLHSFSSHTDGVYALSRIPNALPYMLAGDGDGVLKLWHLGTKTELWSADAHQGRVRGTCADPMGGYALSCGDKTVKMWSLDAARNLSTDTNDLEPSQVFAGSSTFTGVDHHRRKPIFVTSGLNIDVWDAARSQPVQSYQWGSDTISTVKCNYVDTDVVISAGNDRSIVLYDIRAKSPVRKMVMYHLTNSISWNPQEAYTFLVANEDTNAYSFDMRKLEHPTKVYRGHVNAVLSIDYCPTGKAFATGSYDKTIRLWDVNDNKSVHLYHTKRMQRVFGIQYSQDTKYIVSGSDDANMRLWKANPSEKLGVLDNREHTQLKYREKLKERYSNMPEIRKIAKQQIVPKSIKVAKRTREIQLQSKLRKQENLVVHNKKKQKSTSLKHTRVAYVEK